ncbi:MAG: hypothetical protein KatS3mg076_2375 [Candidatus Binatia bacterium]|nr:MAG: hypothetical protein KatS3mg076_2375 [Candidatus Binatia bacterium]
MNELVELPGFSLYAACSAVLVLKMMAVGTYTSILRIGRKRFATPEDYQMQGLAPTTTPDEDIERVRRAHRNDLENILPFFLSGFLYVLAEPTVLGTRVCFLGFTAARILHSIFYIRAMQPHRTIAFMIGYVLLLWMTLVVLFHFGF